jgi:Flp pilus assembly protein TadD
MDSSDGNHLGAGVVEDVLGNHDAAQDHYRQVIQHSPRNLNAKNNMGLSLLLQGKATEAEATLKALTQRADSEPRFDINLALVYGVSGKSGQAQPLLEKYFSQDQVASTLQFYQDYTLLNAEQRRRVVYGFSENPERNPKSDSAAGSLKAFLSPRPSGTEKPDASKP